MLRVLRACDIPFVRVFHVQIVLQKGQEVGRIFRTRRQDSQHDQNAVDGFCHLSETQTHFLSPFCANDRAKIQDSLRHQKTTVESNLIRPLSPGLEKYMGFETVIVCLQNAKVDVVPGSDERQFYTLIYN